MAGVRQMKTQFQAAADDGKDCKQSDHWPNARSPLRDHTARLVSFTGLFGGALTSWPHSTESPRFA
jgi:hypothetical protein